MSEPTISGRSKNFNFDRFLLVHESRDLRKFRNSNPKESKSADANPEPKKIVVRTLTDTQERRMEAKLIRLVGETIQVKIKKKSFEIKLNTRSEEDQEFIFTTFRASNIWVTASIKKEITTMPVVFLRSSNPTPGNRIDRISLWGFEFQKMLKIMHFLMAQV